MSRTTKAVGDEEFEARARTSFRASVERLDAATRSKLNRARHRALAEAGQPGFRLPGLWLPAGALATVAALAIAVFLVSPASFHHVGEAAAVEDTELLTAKDNLDLYAEDPEFFEWAGADAHAAASPAPDRG